MLKLYHSPMACSLASRLALLEAELDHEVVIVRTWKGEQKSDVYRALNPRGKVPALVTDQGVLTESTAILPYIADLAPEKALLPPAGSFARAQAQAWLSFLSSTLHVALSSAMFPAPGSDNDVAKAAAVARVAASFQDIDAHLAGRDYVLEGFSLCDLYLFVFASWRAAPTFATSLPSLANLDRFQQALFARPMVAAALSEDMRARSTTD